MLNLIEESKWKMNSGKSFIKQIKDKVRQSRIKEQRLKSSYERDQVKKYT